MSLATRTNISRRHTYRTARKALAATVLHLAPRAREIIRQYEDKSFSLTDATSFAVMERLRISYAFTFDRNFAQYGFTILTPSSG